MNWWGKSTVLHRSQSWNISTILIIFSATFLVYASTLGYGFMFSWDDYDYVVNNRAIQGISFANLKSVFSDFFVGNYAPFHLLSYMLDYLFWGLNPRGYHLSNLLLHALNGFLVYRLFLKLELRGIPALLGAALFVLHPVQVESVAWVAERKNVLSALFFLLALLYYIDYRQTADGRVRHYIFSLAFFACALLSKSAAVILPVVIIFYDFCYCDGPRRFNLPDKLPFLFFALAASYVTIISQDTNAGGGMRGYPGGTPLSTLWTMLPVFLSYLKDLVYPLDLSPYYIVLIRTSVDSTVALSAAILLCLAGITAVTVKRQPKLLFFISIYILALLPVLQIVPILTLKNDRYLYFPMIGAAGAATMLISILMQGPRRLRNITAAITITVCIALGSVTYYQAQNWKDSITLWQFAIRQNPENMLAWLMLAKGYTNLGYSREAVAAINTYNNLKSKYGPLRGWDGIGS